MRKTIQTLLMGTLMLPLAACQETYPYMDTDLSPQERAEDLVSRLTLEEKVSLMMDVSKPIERLNIKTYNWWNEALHGVARSGLATVFPQAIGMAASFDPAALNEVFVAVSDEARAKNTQAVKNNSFKRYEGLTMWTPNVNIFRDPRWGRGMETYGEDPYLTSVMGLEVVKGLQCLDADSKYDKLHACAKHFAVHSGPEWNRHEFNAENISMRDLYETYLPAFETLAKDGQVKEVMCAYNRYEGEPCCGSNRLLTHILRNEWDYKGIVVSDCWAISDFYNKNAHSTHPDSVAASTSAVLAGTDLECGGNFHSLVKGARKGQIDERKIDVSVKRLLKARFELGEMDDIDEVSWSKIPYSVVASDKHNALALDMARKSLTLLHNKNNLLPLDKAGLNIVVMGPNAQDSVMQWGNYNGVPSHTVTMLDGIKAMVKDEDKVSYIPGCSWVEKTLIHSAFNQCESAQGTGFAVTYWNNQKAEGQPAATALMPTPFNLCTKGATVFAPGVNLTDFAGKYTSVLKPSKSGRIFFKFNSIGVVNLTVDGKELLHFTNDRTGREHWAHIDVEAGKTYPVEILFTDHKNEAQLNFDLGYKEEINIPAVVAQTKAADVVVFVGGISPRLEGEQMGVSLPGFKGGDRTDMELPEVQRNLLKALKRAGKKVVFVNCSGAAMGLVPETHSCDAILQAWYPGQAGGTAVAEVLFGDYNPSGKLPVTFYKNINQIPDFLDYNMTNRTYRYFKGEPLYPFGYGLSYTQFAYSGLEVADKAKAGQSVSIKVNVSNTGQRDGDEVVQVYLSKVDDNEGPLKTLRAFQRVHVKAGQTLSLNFELTPKQLEWFDVETEDMTNLAGKYKIMVGGNSVDLIEKTIEIVK